MGEDLRADIPPVPAGGHRPLWSVMIPTYHCADLLRETLAGVLAQDPGPERMQIEVVDDFSTRDDPEAVVRELGGGRVAFHRQARNVGHVRNFETCLLRSRGELVHLLHGDDRVRPGFYAALERGFGERPDVGMAWCRVEYVDPAGEPVALSPEERAEPGVPDGWLGTIASGQRVATPSVVVRRAVYERLGGFDRRIRCAGEDWEMWVRIAAHYPVWFEPRVLAEYRVKRTGSLTGDSVGTPKLVRDMRLATEIVGGYLADHLPAPAAGEALRRARSQYARWALNDATDLLARRRVAAALPHLAEALRCSRSPRVVRRAARVLLGSLRHWLPGSSPAGGT